MIQVIRRENDFGRDFAKALSGAIGNIGEGYFEGKEKQRLENERKDRDKQAIEAGKNLFGMDLSGFDPETRKALTVEALKQKGQSDLFEKKSFQERLNKQQKQQENVQPLEGALDVVNHMRNLRKKGNLGIGATYSPFEETRKEAGEYSQLGKSLIQYSTNIPIRNRLEFEALAEDLYDPNITDAKAEGILNAMEKIIINTIRQYSEDQGLETNRGPVKSKERPPLSSFKIGKHDS